MMNYQPGWVVRLSLLLSLMLVLYSSQSQGYKTSTMHVHSKQYFFVIKLPANLSTGFEWTIQHYDKTILNLDKHTYQAARTTRVGAGGEMIYRFSRRSDAFYPASTTIVFRNARPWEPASLGTLQYITVLFD